MNYLLIGEQKLVLLFFSIYQHSTAVHTATCFTCFLLK